MRQQRNTRQRKMVLEAVKAHRDHPTADDIYLDLRKIDERISRGTVYRNLNVLVKNGEIKSFKIDEAERFDWRVDGHYHLECYLCNKIVDIDLPYNDELDKKVSEQSDYVNVRHKMFFEGICPECQIEKLKDKSGDKK